MKEESEGWTPRNEALLEAVLEQAKTTRHPWLIACDANMCQEDVERARGFRWTRKKFSHVSLRETASKEKSQMKVVEDFESRPHKAVSFVVEREKNGMSRSFPKLQWNKVARKKH